MSPCGDFWGCPTCCRPRGVETRGDLGTLDSDPTPGVSSTEAGHPALGSAAARESRADGGPGPSGWPGAQSHASGPCEEKGAVWPLSDSGKCLVRLDSTSTRPGEDRPLVPPYPARSSLSRVCLLGTLWSVGRQAPLSMDFPRKADWSGLPFTPLGALADPGIEPWAPALQADSLQSEP